MPAQAGCQGSQGTERENPARIYDLVNVVDFCSGLSICMSYIKEPSQGAQHISDPEYANV